MKVIKQNFSLKNIFKRLKAYYLLIYYGSGNNCIIFSFVVRIKKCSILKGASNRTFQAQRRENSLSLRYTLAADFLIFTGRVFYLAT